MTRRAHARERVSFAGPHKAQYRVDVWQELETKTSLATVAHEDRCLIVFDDKDALEVLYLVRVRGYRLDQVTVAQRSTGKAAAIRKSVDAGLGLDSKKAGLVIRTDGLAAAARAAVAQGRLVHAVHADFCGFISPAMLGTLAALPLLAADTAVAVAVNVLACRDNGMRRTESRERFILGALRRRPPCWFERSAGRDHVNDRNQAMLVVTGTLKRGR